MKEIRNKVDNISSEQLNNFFTILASVTDAFGVSGHEHGVVKVIKKLVKPYAQSITNCGQGSLIIAAKNNVSGPNRKTLMIDAHMDEVGLMVTNINCHGYLNVIPVGGLWNHALLAQKYFLVTRAGKQIPAVVGSIPVHIVTQKQRRQVVKTESLYLDIGAENRAEVIKAGVSIGDVAYKATKTFRMLNDKYVCGKALDNRFSCATLIFLLQNLAKIKLPLNVIIVFSCQEEVGLRGVKTATYQVNPDFAIVVDTTVSNDQSESDVRDSCCLGGGPIMSIADAYVNSNQKFLLHLQDIANQQNIKYGYNASLGGGTNGGYVYRARKGVTTVVVSLATRYLHSHTEVCNMKDGIQTAALIKQFITTFNSLKFLKNVEKNFCDAAK